MEPLSTEMQDPSILFKSKISNLSGAKLYTSALMDPAGCGNNKGLSDAARSAEPDSGLQLPGDSPESAAECEQFAFQAPHPAGQLEHTRLRGWAASLGVAP